MKYAVLSILAVILLAGVLLIIKSTLFRVIKSEENCSASGEKKSFWSKYAGIYESFMKKDERAYERMYTLIPSRSSRKGSPRACCRYGNDSAEHCQRRKDG